MRFTYYWKGPDGVRRDGEIAAPSLDEAFAALRAQGIRPIRMFGAGDARQSGGRRTKWILAAVAVLGGLAVLAALWIAAVLGRRGDAPPSEPETRRGAGVERAIESKVVRIDFGRRKARPHPRRYIGSLAGKVRDIACFRRASEAYLARFAMPGLEADGLPEETPELISDLRDALEEDIEILPGDSADVAELKRIVAGLKEDADSYLRSGAGLSDFLKFLRLRQRMECDTRRRIVEDAMSGGDQDGSRAREADEMLGALGLPPIDRPTPSQED